MTNGLRAGSAGRLLAGAACWALALTAGAAWAAVDTAAAAGLDWLSMGSTLFGGLALFLFGMDQLSHGLKGAAGEQLKDLLGRLTRNRVLGALTGAFVTAILNSSSVTTVLVVGFITAGMMTLAQSIGVIMGANVGSTFTAQIIAFNVTSIGLPMVALGFLMMTTGRRDRVRFGGEMLMGLGLVFFGMGVMSQGMNPLRTYEPFLELMARMENPIMGILVGTLFTGLVQSSAATTGIAIVMAGDGLITLPAGIALAFGANIGTCVTAVLAAIGKPVEAVRAAAAHIAFNVAGVLIWVAFIPELAELVRAFSPAYPDLAGTDRLAAEVPRQIANAHSLFNVANTVLFIGFTGVLARVVVRMVPERPPEVKVIVRPRFLDREVLRAPSLALERVRFELGHVGEIVRSMYTEMDGALRSRNLEKLEAVVEMDDQVDILEAEILDYLREIRKLELSDTESDDFVELMTAANELENIGDVMETDMVGLGRRLLERDFRASESMGTILDELYSVVGEALDNAIAAVRDGDERAAQAVLAAKAEVDRRRVLALRHQAEAIGRDDPETRLWIFRMEMEVVEQLKRIYGHARRIARTVLPPELASRAG
jgi:phosphate:Na+ symporter